MMISKLIEDYLGRTGTMTVADLESELSRVEKGPALQSLSQILLEEKKQEQYLSHLLKICGPRL